MGKYIPYGKLSKKEKRRLDSAGSEKIAFSARLRYNESEAQWRPVDYSGS